MPTLKKGGFWSSYYDYYYCDDCGKWYYTNAEAEQCEGQCGDCWPCLCEYNQCVCGASGG